MKIKLLDHVEVNMALSIFMRKNCLLEAKTSVAIVPRTFLANMEEFSVPPEMDRIPHRRRMMFPAERSLDVEVRLTCEEEVQLAALCNSIMQRIADRCYTRKSRALERLEKLRRQPKPKLPR